MPALPLSPAGGLSTRRSVVRLAMVACTGERAQLLGLLCAEVADGIAVVKKQRHNQDQSDQLYLVHRTAMESIILPACVPLPLLWSSCAARAPFCMPLQW